MKKIIFDPSKCAGCGFCASSCPKFFEIREGKSHIIGSKKEGEKEVLEIDEKISESDLECIKSAVEICPMKAIYIKEE